MSQKPKEQKRPAKLPAEEEQREIADEMRSLARQCKGKGISMFAVRDRLFDMAQSLDRTIDERADGEPVKRSA
jgi:hypothetical protein